MRCPAEYEGTALNVHPQVFSPEIDLAELELHPPVAALKNLILEDPSKQLYHISCSTSVSKSFNPLRIVPTRV